MKKRGIKRTDEGFTLLEFLISMVLFLVVAGAILGALLSYQQRYRGLQLRSDLDQNMTAALTQMSEEIGQAGTVSTAILKADTVPLEGSTGAVITLNGSVSGTGTSQTVSVGSTDNLFVNEKVSVGTGSTEEVVEITSLGSSSITATFTEPHASGDPVVPTGVFLMGIIPPYLPAGSGLSSTAVSTSQTLKMFGDFNGDGTDQVVVYDCTGASATNPVNLTRSATPLSQTGGLDAGVIVMPRVVSCQFTYDCGATGTNGSGACSASNNTVVNGVTLSITAESQGNDPQTGAPVKLTRTMVNIQPRNLLMGYARYVANASDNDLQPTPSVYTTALGSL